jgi:hypothetical protein
MIPIKQRVVEGSMLRLIKQSLTAEIAYERKVAAGRAHTVSMHTYILRTGGRILLKPSLTLEQKQQYSSRHEL